MDKIITMPNNLHKISAPLFVLLILLCGKTEVLAQSLTQKNWYFGNSNKGVQFGRPNYIPSLINKPTAFGTGGSAVATDANTGNLLFYTDGNNVYDVSNTLMPNSGLGGNTNANQAAVITPVPGVPNQYYVFTMTATGAVEQAIVQTDAPGSETFPTPPLGNVISKNVATGLTGQSGAMIIIPSPNGVDSWLITQTANSNSYTVTSITAGGLTSTVVPGLGVPLTAASFSFHEGTGKIAVAPKDQNKNVAVLDFETTTGALTFDPVFNQLLLNTGTASNTTEAIYDTEWSSDGKYLYISRNGDPSVPVAADVLQVDLTTASLPVSILPPTLDIVKSYGLQMGPDSAIYQLYENSLGQFVMGKITNTDKAASLVVYTPQVFPGVDFKSKQFPSFSPPAVTTYSIAFTTLGSCTNSPITFFPTVTPAADSVVWDFGDGSPPLNSWSPVHTFTSAGGTVTARAYSNGVAVATTSQPLSLTQFDLQLSLQSDTTACSCELKFPNIANPPPPCTAFTVVPQSQGGASPTYQWYGPSGLLVGKTSLTLDEVDSAGYYYVKATQGACSVTAGQNIKEYHVQDQRSNIWHFGKGAGIDFNPMFFVPPQPITPISSPVNASEGVATISDQNGQVILSTDGKQVYDRNGNALIPSVPPPAPGDLTSTQSSIIVPVPGDETLYYIFTTDPVEDGTYRVSYMLFDLKLGTIGGIVDPDNNPATNPSTELYVKSTERLTGNNNWVITHEYGNNSFRAYSVSANGLGAPVISDIGSNHSITSLQNAQGYMELGPQNRLAVALSDGSSNVIELFDFIDSTGAVTNYRRIDLNQPAGQIYGLEFSPGGNKLYATVKNGGTSIIYEYAIDAQGVATLLQKTPPITGELGAMQTGPDGQVYIAVNGGSALLFFTPNDNLLQPTAGLKTLQPFNLVGTSTLGLPNFIQTLGEPLQSPGMSVVGSCVNVPVNFSATPSDQYRDDYTWLVNDQNGAFVTSSTDQNFQFTFTTPGTYQVTLDITSTCLNNTVNPNGGNKVAPTFTYSLVINPEPAAAISTSDGLVVFCQLPATKGLTASPNVGSFAYSWTTGETTNPITVTQAGTYGVTVTDNVTGCSGTTSIDLFNNAPIVDLGLDFAMCSDDVRTLNAQNPASGNTYTWQIDNGATVGSSQLFNVNTALTGTHEYKVTVSDGTCSASDAVLVTVNPVPTFTSTVLTQPSCGASNGDIRIDITSTGNFTIDFATKPLRPGQPTGAVLPSYSALTAGTYTVILTNDLTGCNTQSAVGLNNTGFTVTPTFTSPSCDPVAVTVNRTLGGTGALSYIFTNNANGQIIGPNTDPGLAVSFITPAIAPGDYILQVTDATSCITTAPVTIVPGTPVTFTLTQGCGTISATPTNIASGSYSWSGPPGSIVLGTETGQTVQITPGPSRTISVTVSDVGNVFCKSTQALDVIVDVINPVITSSSPCEDQVTLSAQPVGSYTYQWTTPTGTNAGQQITVGAGGSGSYSVKVLSTLSGCSGTSAPFSLTILGKVIVDLATTLPCKGQEFTLTATATPVNAVLSWFFNGNSLPGTDNPRTATLAGKYKVNALVTGCPVVSSEKNISLLPVDEGKLPSAAIICDDPANPIIETSVAVLHPGSNFASYTWFKNSVALGDTDSTYTASTAGLYSVDLINSFGCATTDQTEVTVECNPNLNAPTAFKPSSGVSPNTYFSVYPLFISNEDFQMFIFNRWGEMVYQSTNLAFQWNGTYNNNGLPLPPGTYSWVAKYKSSYRPADGIKVKHGGVVLLR